MPFTTDIEKTIWTKHLEERGNPGNYDAIGDYSSSPADFQIKAVEGRYEIHRMTVCIQDTGSVQADKYGAMNALTVGISVQNGDDGGAARVDYTDGQTIKTNAQWALYSNAELKKWGAGDEILLIRWAFIVPIMVHADGDKVFRFRLNDDFTGLTGHRFTLQGRTL